MLACFSLLEISFDFHSLFAILCGGLFVKEGIVDGGWGKEGV